MQQLSEVENTQLGVAAGVIEVTCMQSVNYLKNASQQGLPYTLDPRILYRGYFANTLNMGLGTGFQFLINGTVKRVMVGNDRRQLTPAEQLGAGFIAGSTSALLISPTELLMIQQQRKGGGIVGAAGIVLGTSSTTMLRGMVTTAMREGIYTAGYLGVGPSVREFIVATHGYSEDAARVPAAILGGAFACLLSHPFDTCKTCMQGDIERVKYRGMTETFRSILAERGAAGTFAGVPWRLGRHIAAVFILDKARVELAPVLFPGKFHE